MSDKDKSLCKWKKDSLVENFDQFAQIVSTPTYVCKKCRRVASEKKWLCSSVAIASIASKAKKKKIKKRTSIRLATRP